jgi:basic membrane protein A and related proteins
MAPYGDAVPDEVRQAADAVQQAIIDGTMHPFQGPIRNQAGEVVVAEGEVVSDQDLLGMNWYVEGVQGELPK